IDMNIERAMIAYAINGVISQRLVRRVCKSCLAPYAPSDKLIEQFKLKGAGCEKCDHSGYLGRVGVFEVFEFDEVMRSLIVQNVPMQELENHMEQAGMKTLREDALEKVRL